MSEDQKVRRGKKITQPLYSDDPERHDLKSRLWLLFSPFLFPPKKRGKEKRRLNSKNRDFKSCLSGSTSTEEALCVLQLPF